MHISRLSVGVAFAVLLSGNAIAGALEDCAAAYDRQDYAEAVRLCRPLAEHGDARAQTSLGGMYYNGQGVQRDYVEAAKWVGKAAEQDYAPAQADLGVMYWNGQGVPQDAVLAYMWLNLPAAGSLSVGAQDHATSRASHGGRLRSAVLQRAEAAGEDGRVETFGLAKPKNTEPRDEQSSTPEQ